MPDKLLIDYAEQWYIRQGIPIFPRCTMIALKMYEAWVNYAFARFKDV